MGVTVAAGTGWIRAAAAGRLPLLSVLLLAAAWRPAGAAAEIVVDPPRLLLDGGFAAAQLVARQVEPGREPDVRSPDVTATASWRSENPAVAAVSDGGAVTAVGDGTTRIVVEEGGASRTVDVEVRGVVPVPVVEFTRDVLPVLTRSGCNAGACHASQYGKGGFVLSVMAFDPQADHHAIAFASHGRRIARTHPEGSLLLEKATNRTPHGGGTRFAPESQAFRILATWIAAGAPPPVAEPLAVTALEVAPAKRIASSGDRQQLRVVAVHADGSRRDVTAWARFDAMDEGVVTVTPAGVATATGRGQGTVMARFADHAAIATFVVPFAAAADLSGWVSRGPLDDLARDSFAELGLTPSGLCDDATFLRRAFLDATGSLPTVEEAREFLASTDPDKRDRLVDRLLGLTGDPAQDRYVDRFAAYQSLKWADLIRNNSAVLGESGMWALHNWLRESFRTHKPFDRFVTELVTAKGSIFSNGPANYFRIANNPPDVAESTAQLFLGRRLQCAKCHHHPYERLSQADYYGFAAFFARVATKGSAEFGVFGGETVVVVNSSGEVSHPRTGAVMKPTPLEGTAVEESDDRRAALAGWLTAPENAWFARNVANRYVALLLGRGLVEPIDDLRATNPASNPALLDALAAEFRGSGFDVRRLMRAIMRSRLYHLDSQPNESNAADERFYSHYRVKRLAAEPLLDAIDDATLVRTKHPNLPLGTRAIELPDAAAATTNPFLVTFGKPKRASVCECERTPDENLAQALHTLNGDIVAAKVADPNGRVARLVAAGGPPAAGVEELFLATLSRPPRPDELAAATAFVAACPTPQEGYQDLLWALVNSKHFLFNR